jgi:hypothetical protein
LCSNPVGSSLFLSFLHFLLVQSSLSGAVTRRRAPKRKFLQFLEALFKVRLEALDVGQCGDAFVFLGEIRSQDLVA